MRTENHVARHIKCLLLFVLTKIFVCHQIQWNFIVSNFMISFSSVLQLWKV